MQNPADTDPVHQAVSHHRILLDQYTLALREVMEGLRDLTTKVLEIRDQVSAPEIPCMAKCGRHSPGAPKERTLA
ncbi:uncharacterized protein AKAME5_000876900 [Lates japonicus]|uniref:Uncharacterized protein n=1 Tax=Lates japonicus TaxID=270547 RepID=A0AAD3MMX0_LATJO|nr:uncharacterized protein AKAME5_000876900 [Lates japonicus]